MTTKKATRFQRTENAVNRHPWLKWGTIVAIVSVLGIIVPAVYFIANHYQTADDARQHAMDDLISRSYLQLSIGNNAQLFIDRSVRNAKIKQALEPKSFSAYDKMVLEADEKTLADHAKNMEPIKQLIIDLTKEKAKGTVK